MFFLLLSIFPRYFPGFSHGNPQRPVRRHALPLHQPNQLPATRGRSGAAQRHVEGLHRGRWFRVANGYHLPSTNYGYIIDMYGLLLPIVPVVPHKAVAEVSETETYRRVWLLWITDGWVNPLMDRKLVGVVFFLAWLQWLQWSPDSKLLDVAWCTSVL